MEEIKTAFSKVKEEIKKIHEEIGILKNDLLYTRERLIEVCDILVSFEKKFSENKKNNKFSSKLIYSDQEISFNESEERNNKNSDFFLKIPLDRQTDNSTDNIHFPTDNSNFPTREDHFKARKDQYLGISKGNQGVQTDRQTDRQTDQQTKKEEKNALDNAVEILDSLDNLKKEMRLKFKRLTEQETLIFSTIYQLEEEIGYSDYKSLARRLNLSESSIRDYVRRLITKGIPLNKQKINNKEIHLFVDKNLKKVASLSTILSLREI